MSKRDELIERYAADLREKCEIEPDLDLLRKVTIACGPAVYRRDAATVSSSDGEELRRIERNFLVGKLGLPEGESLMGGIQAVIRVYGHDNRNKYRAVFYYMLTKHFGKEAVFA